MSEKWIAAAGALPIVIGFVLSLVRRHKKQAFDFRAAAMVIGSWLISFLVMWLLLIFWFWNGGGSGSFFQKLGWSLLFVILFFPIQAYAVVLGALVVCMWSLVGVRWVFNILCALTVLSFIWLVIVAIEGIQI